MTKAPNVFTDMGFDAEEAANLALRSELMMRIEQWFRDSGRTQAAAAKTLGVSQPRMNLLLKGKIGEFSLDALVNMATRAGLRVVISIRPATRKAAREGQQVAA